MSIIVAKVSGEPYETFIQKNIFDPLQMASSGFKLPNVVLPHAAFGYASWAASATRDNPPSWAFPNGAYGMYSTAEDLFRWNEALGLGALSEKLWTAMFTPYEDIGSSPAFPPSFSSVSIGYGWFITKDANHRLAFYDDSPGNVGTNFALFNGRYLDDKVSVIALGNQPANVHQVHIGAALAAIAFARH